MDTDYDNYVLAYSCQENAYWDDVKTDLELDFGDVFKVYKNWAEKDGVDLTAEGTNLYAAENFENL